MKITVRRDTVNNTRNFKLLKCPMGLPYEATLNTDNWRLVDEDLSLLRLLTRNNMLAFEESEIRWAKHKLKMLHRLKALTESDTTLDYCLLQAKLVAVYGDDPMYRIATKLIDARKFACYDKYGLSSDVRRLILALVLELGVIID